MKKIYLLVLSLLFTAASFSQVYNVNRIKIKSAPELTPVEPTSKVCTLDSATDELKYIEIQDFTGLPYVTLGTDQTITGTKTFNTGDVNTNIYSINSDLSRGIVSENTGLGDGIYAENTGDGTAIDIRNASEGLGTGLSIVNSSSGSALWFSSTTLSDGYVIESNYNLFDTFTLDKFGNVVANTFVKSSATSDDILLGDGSTTSLSALATTSESDTDYVNVTGDTMTGPLTLSGNFSNFITTNDLLNPTFSILHDISGNPSIAIQNASGTTVTSISGISGSVTANTFVKSSATSDDVLLGDGSTTSLTGITTGYATLAGTQTFTGTNTFNTGDTNTNIYSINTTTGTSILTDNNGNGNAIKVENNSNGYGVYINNDTNGSGVYVNNFSGGSAINVNADASSSGFIFRGTKAGTDAFTVDDDGDVRAKSYTVPGSTSDDVLLGNGSTTSKADLIQTLDKSGFIESPVLNDYIPIFRTYTAITLQSVYAMLNAAGDIDLQLYFDTDFTETGNTTIGTASTITTTAETAVNIATDPTIPAGRWVFLKVTQADTPQDLAISLTFTED